MADAKWLIAKGKILGVQARSWGSSGHPSLESIERELEVRLGSQIADFVETLGNVSVGPFLIAVAGNERGEMSSVTETKAARTICATLPHEYVKVMDHAGESYFYDSRTGGVYAFDSLNVNLSMKTLSFDDFDRFLEWAFEETKLQSEDGRFAF